MSPSPEYTSVEVPARIADLAFTYLRPADFQAIALPDDKPDFEAPTSFYPLHVAMANYGLVLFSAGARPAFADGTVEDWAEFISREAKLEILEVKRGVVGGLPAVMLELRQEADGTMVRLRTAFIEDGKRLLNLSVIAPEAIWSNLEGMLQLSLSSFRLAEPRGSTVPVMRSDAPQVSSPVVNQTPPVESDGEAVPVNPDTTPTPMAELALADEATTFDPEHPFNVRMRDNRGGLAVRVLAINAAEKFATLGAGALVATFDAPFGWHVIDDGRRTLVCDAAGKIQISLNLRRAGEDTSALLDQILNEAMAEQPEIDPLRLDFAPDLPGLVLRNYRDGDDVLVQAFIAKRLREDGLVHVARITAAPDEMTRAMNLAEVILRSLQIPVTAP